MAIKYKMPITIKTIESRYSLDLERKRPDVKNVLKSLSNGEKLEKLFPVPSVYHSILKQFVERGYIDGSQQLQEKGKEFIENPYYGEQETGIYSINFTEIQLNGTNYSMLLKLNRRLANKDSRLIKFSFDNVVYDNEVSMDADETITVKRLLNKSNSSAYVDNDKSYNMEIDLSSQKYNAGYGYMKLGDTLSSKILPSLKDIFDSSVKYLNTTDSFDKLIIQNVKDIDFESLLNCKYSASISGFDIVDHPIQIDDEQVAYQYAYLFMFNKIINGEYLKYDEMNEIFENEVLSTEIYSEKIKTKMSGFTYSESGFEKYLSKDNYEAMAYKLKVMDELLNYTLQDNSLKNVRNYSDLVEYLSTQVSPKDVVRVNLVLGYPFADIKTNQIIDCIEAFQQKYKDIAIIQKNDGKNQREDESIRQSVKDHNVVCKVNKEIKTLFHDRYIVFEMNDKTTKTMLATNEVGQFFNLNTNEPLGTIMLISNDEVVRNNKNLYTMIKEAR